jgi:hypothetical protein
MSRLAVLALALLVAVSSASASNAVSLGYSDETTIIGPARECSAGTLVYNHDGSFENGYAWGYGGCQPPYYGAFGEAYDLGAGTVTCGAYWLTTANGGYGICDPADCYLWEGGVAAEPNAVLAVVTGADFTSMGIWPDVTEHDVDMDVGVAGAFTVGYWANMQGGFDFFFCGADENGPRGHPWTCIAPDQGYPSGWQDPALVGGWWGPTKSLGLGIYFEQTTPVESETWGAVKALFR